MLAAISIRSLSRTFERHIPVGVAQESGPACDPDSGGVIERFPGGAHRSAAQSHAGLVRSAVRLAGIAGDAREGAVFPGCLSSLGAG